MLGKQLKLNNSCKTLNKKRVENDWDGGYFPLVYFKIT